MTVVAGQTKTCRIVNTDNTPKLTLVKDVQNNDGGAQTADDWTLTATAAAPNDGRNITINGGTGPDGTVYHPADDSNGNQLPDIRIGDIYVEGPNACKIAVDILDKRPVGDPTKVYDKPKAAGDPVVNATAQLLAYELNQLLNPGGTGSASCQTKADAAAQMMQKMLDSINYTTAYSLAKKVDATQAKINANLLYLAEILDDYNNNTITGCGTPITLPYPNVPVPPPGTFDS